MSNPARRLWVVEALFSDGTWEICTFAGHPFASDDRKSACGLIDAIQKHLQCITRGWTKKHFRVVEYIPVKKRK